MPLSQQSAHGGHKSQRLIEHQVMACSRNSDYLDVFSAKIVHEIPRVTCEQQAFLAMDDRLAAWRRHKLDRKHTSELQSLMRISYAVFCLKKKNTNNNSR